MAEAPEDFAVHRFVRDLFEDLSLTLPALGCVFEGTVTPNALTVHGESQTLRNKLFLFFADLASGTPRLGVRFHPALRGSDLVLGFFCEPFDAATARTLPTWDGVRFELLSAAEAGFAVTLPAGRPLEVGPPVHWHQLAQRYGGASHGLKVLEQFVTRCRSLLPSLEAAIASDDAPDVLRVAHTLKGSARGVTADAVAEAALQLEMLGRSGNLTGAVDLYKALLVTYDECIRWVREGQS